MIFLEIVMLIIGLGAVAFSFRMSDKQGVERTDDDRQEMIPVPVNDIDDKLQEAIDQLEKNADLFFRETDDKLSELSNEKIMGMSEYSDQVLDKIEKNHAEAVFLYDMLNEKQEEMKQLVADMDSIRADLHNESALEYQKLKEQEKELLELRKNIEVEMLEYEAAQKKYAVSKQETEQEPPVIPEGSAENPEDDSMEELQMLLTQTENALEKKESMPDEETKPPFSAFDEEMTKMEEDASPKVREAGKSKSEQEGDMVNRNDEILSLYKKGRSILEISKMLSMGQGEVKFVIDMYHAR